jgi:hypothetical protein
MAFALQNLTEVEGIQEIHQGPQITFSEHLTVISAQDQWDRWVHTGVALSGYHELGQACGHEYLWVNAGSIVVDGVEITDEQKEPIRFKPGAQIAFGCEKFASFIIRHSQSPLAQLASCPFH